MLGSNAIINYSSVIDNNEALNEALEKEKEKVHQQYEEQMASLKREREAEALINTGSSFNH